MKLSPLRPVRLKSHDVMVVPMLAPMIMPTTCSRRIMPEFTKPTTITVVAELDCTTAVTPAPSAIAAKRLLVARSSVLSSIPPECCSKPPLMSCIPNRENESPATNVNTCVQISKFIQPPKFVKGLKRVFGAEFITRQTAFFAKYIRSLSTMIINVMRLLENVSNE